MRTICLQAPRMISMRLASVAVVTIALMTSVAQGSIVERILDASLTSGSMANTEFTVRFSYDDSNLTGQGQEFLPLQSFNFALGNAVFTRDDIFQGGQAIFQDGVLQNVTAAFFPELIGRPPNAPVRSIVFGFGTDRGIAYTDLVGNDGQGSFSFEEVSATYDDTVLADHPVAFWNVTGSDSTEPDLTGNGNTGTYQGGMPGVSAMPNGDQAAVFDGAIQYLSVPSNSSFSIPTTGNLTWEMWIQPTELQFPNSDGQGNYVNVVGKCASHPNTGLCEWEARMYNNQPATQPDRYDRLGAYAFDPDGGEGVSADWQPVSNSLFQPGEWLYVVGEYTTDPSETPAVCDQNYPGTLNIWVNGVEWNQSFHGQTGCWNQPNVALVIPQATDSPFNIGTVDTETWFEGAIAKVAIYNYLLTQSQIASHYKVMTGMDPTGSCAATCSF